MCFSTFSAMSHPAESLSKSPVAGRKVRGLDFDGWFSWWRVLLIVLGLMVISFPDLFLAGRVFVYRDAGLFNYPTHYFFRDSILHGELPMWNPYNNCGIPFLAQWNVMALYPLSFLYALFPVPWSITFLSLAHLLIAAAGMYFLAHRWTQNRFGASIAAIAFAWNGITLHSTMWPNSCASIAWMPWTVFFMDRAMREGGRYILYGALVGAMQMLGGVPEIILYTWLIVGGVFVLQLIEQKHGRVLLRAVAAGLLVAGLTAAQMLPFIDFLQHSQRGSSYATDTWAMPPWGWANFFVPAFRTSPDFIGVFTQTEQQWATSYYFGAAIFALAILAAWRAREPRVWLLIAFTVVGCVFALGKAGIAYELARKAIPLLGVMRYPAKWVQLAMFCAPLLAAFAVNWLKGEATKEESTAGRDLLKIGISIVAVMIAIVFVAIAKPRADEPPPITIVNAVVRFVFLAGVVFAAANAFSESPLFSRKNTALLAIVLLGIDLSFHLPTGFEEAARQAEQDGKAGNKTMSRFPTVSGKKYQPVQLPMSPVPKLGESRAMLTAERVATMRKAGYFEPNQDFFGKRITLFMNCNIYDHVPKVDGLSSLYLKHQAEVQDNIYTKGKISEGLMDFLGATQISAPDPNPPQHLFDWQPRQQALPLVTIGQKPVFVGDSDSLDAIFSREFTPMEKVFLPKEAEAEVKAKQFVAEAHVSLKEISNNKLTCAAQSKEPTLVVVSQTYYHPWKAYVDNQPAKIWRANHAYQAVEIPAGDHQVRFVYEDDRFRLGLLISAASVLVWVGAWFALKRRVPVPTAA